MAEGQRGGEGPTGGDKSSHGPLRETEESRMLEGVEGVDRISRGEKEGDWVGIDSALLLRPRLSRSQGARIKGLGVLEEVERGEEKKSKNQILARFKKNSKAPGKKSETKWIPF